MKYNEKNIKTVEDFVERVGLGKSLYDIFNPTQKYDYVGYKYGSTSDDNLSNILRTFNRFGVYESQFDKDLCEFSYQEYKEMLSSFNIGYSSFNAQKTFIKSYLKWCRYYDLCDNAQIMTFDQITKDIVPYNNQIVKHYVKNFDELQKFINICVESFLTRKSDFIDQSNMAKIAMYLAWIGVPNEDVAKITLDDFDESNKRIFIKSKNAYVDFKLFNKALGDELINYKLSSNNIKKNELYLFYNFSNIQDYDSYLKNSISRIFGDNEFLINRDNKTLSYVKVYLSGIYSRAVKYAEEITLQNPELMGELFQENYLRDGGYAAMYRRYRDFLSYCETMYPEEYKTIKFK